jgi:hypothetical protein
MMTENMCWPLMQKWWGGCLPSVLNRLSGDAYFNLLGSYRRLNELGAEWRSDLRWPYQRLYSLYQPFSATGPCLSPH